MSRGPIDPEPPTRRPDASQVMAEALARPLHAREAWVHERTAPWPELATQVLQLLRASERTETFRGAPDHSVLDPTARLPKPPPPPPSHVTGNASTWQDFLAQLREVGCNFARYRGAEPVDQGGQGVILRVDDVISRRTLAMKRLRAQQGIGPGDVTPQVDDETLGRFLDEAQIQAQLDHPAIVPVHEIGLDDRDRVYFTMKYVKGETLKEAFARVRAGEPEWTTERALHIVVRVAEAMAYAHDKGVVHRDLKPGNVMVGRFGEVFVMDWGLARVLGEPDRRDLRIAALGTPSRRRHGDGAESTDDPTAIYTCDGHVLGTPWYMPPEQAAGRIEQVGRAADVYAVGAILYCLFAGHAPYEHAGSRQSSRTVLELVQKGPPPPLATVAPRTPPALVAIVERAMARAIEDRHPSMLALADDLRRWLDRRPAPSWTRARRPSLRAAALAGLVLAAGGYAFHLRSAANQREDALRAAVAACKERLAAAAPAQRAELEALLAELERALPTSR